MLTDVEVFAIRAVGLPAHIRARLYPELDAQPAKQTCGKCGTTVPAGTYCKGIDCPLNPSQA